MSLWHQRVTYYDYLDEYKPKPLYLKSVSLNEKAVDFKKQKTFDEKLELYGLAPSNPSYGAFDALRSD